jgi:hypothetical protein
MMAVTKFLAGGAAIAALASAAPAAAQYYPGYGYGYPSGGNVVGQVLNQVLGGGYGYNGYGMNSQQVVNICANAIQQRLGGYGYGYGNSYGYGYGGGARVLGITSIEQRGSGGGGLRVRGVATSGGGYNQGPDLTWKCSVDYRGSIVGLDVNRGSYGYGNYTPYNLRLFSVRLPPLLGWQRLSGCVRRGSKSSGAWLCNRRQI